MLVKTTLVSRIVQTKVLGGERRSNANVNNQTLGVLPAGESNIPWSTPWFLGVTKDAPLFQYWGQKALITHLGNKISDAIVTHDDVSILFAARGVIAVQVKRLRAKRTTDIRARHMDPETVPDRGTKDGGRHDAIRTLDPGRNGSHPGPRVLCYQAI